MNRSILAFTVAAFVAGPLLTANGAENWPQWRGPNFNGAAPEAKPPVKWTDTENVKWKYKIPGFGTSSPVIWGDKVFITTAISTGKKEASVNPTGRRFLSVPAAQAQAPEGERPRRRRGGPGGPGGGGFGGFGGGEKPTETHQFVLLAIDRNTGKLLWQKTAREEVPHEGHHRDHGYASASAVTDGEHVYAFFGSRGLHCYDMEGNKKWEKDFGDMRTRNAFGEGASPALHGDTLVVNWDHEGDDFVVALNAKTGEERWRKQRDEPTSWATPLIIEHEGKAQVVVSATNRVRSYDLATGEQIWECGGMTGNVIPTPIHAFGMLYAISGFRGAALLAIDLSKAKGDITNKSEAIVWKHNRGTPYVPSPALSGERLYFLSGNNGTLSCFNAKTGQSYYEGQRIEHLLGGVYSSPVAASGHVFIFGRDGKAVVIKDADQFEVVAQNKLDDRVDASPALVGNQMFVRGHQYLYCISE